MLMSLKRSRIFFYFSMVCILGGLVFLYYHQRGSNDPKTQQRISHYRYPQNRHQIRGFTYYGTHEGKKIISIKADKFAIEKKKLGFFRLGLIDEAIFKNAVIDIYGKREEPVRNSTLRVLSQTTDISGSDVKESQGITFKAVFAEEVLQSFPKKHISSIMIEPISLNLHDENSLVTKITASSASIRLKERDILFEGDVRVVSDTRLLKADKLSMRPEDSVISTDGHFTLKTPEKKWEGQRLTTDIFLMSHNL
jgi:hypothetical protein